MSTLFMLILLPMDFTDKAAAKEPIIKDNLSGNFLSKQSDDIANIASPAPILSTAFFE